MKKFKNPWPSMALLGGCCAFCLRQLQQASGFEADTGLAVPGSPWGILLPAFLAAAALLFLLRGRSAPAGVTETASLRAAFPAQGAPILAYAGGLLWLASAALTLMKSRTPVVSDDGYEILYDGALSAGDLLSAALAALAGVCVLCVLGHPRQEGRRAEPNSLLLLAAITALVIRLVLCFRELSRDPSLQRYYLPLLAMTVPVTLLLLDTPLFAALRHPAKAPVSALNTKKDWTIFVVASLIAGFVPPIMAPVIIQQTSKIFSLTGQGTTGSIFVYGVANNVVVWMMFSALFLLAMFFLFYNVIHKKNGVKLADYDLKVSLADVGRIILMVFAVVLTCRSVVWFADYFFKVDFRLVDLSMATMNWNHLRVSLCYAPFFILYWCINSLTMNGCNRFKNMSEGKNLLLCVLCNTLGTVVVVLVYYICLYKSGCGIGAFGNWKAYMMLSYMILSATAGTIINRKIYNATGSLYLGPAVFGTLIAIINTAVYTLPAA